MKKKMRYHRICRINGLSVGTNIGVKCVVAIEWSLEWYIELLSVKKG